MSFVHAFGMWLSYILGHVVDELMRWLCCTSLMSHILIYSWCMIGTYLVHWLRHLLAVWLAHGLWLIWHTYMGTHHNCGSSCWSFVHCWCTFYGIGSNTCLVHGWCTCRGKMIVGDGTWLKYTIGITCLAYTLIHDVWDSWDTCFGAWLVHYLTLDAWYTYVDT
jgi:hypothetical protein